MYAEATRDTTAIEDIADKLESDKQLFEEEENRGTKYNKMPKESEEECKYTSETRTGTRSDQFNYLLD